MESLKITATVTYSTGAKRQEVLTAKENDYFGHRVRLNIFYTDKGTTCSCYLTPKRAARLRDWLTRWLKEHA